MALFKKGATLLEFRSHLQEQYEIAEANRFRATVENDGPMALRAAHLAQWLAAVLKEVDEFEIARSAVDTA